MILVVGATGTLGGMIARNLMSRGETVSILVRPDSDYKPLVEAGAWPVRGDLKDPASLVEACRGVDILVTTANSAMRGGEDNPETVDLLGNRHLIDAARINGVRHFVFTSAHPGFTSAPAPFPQAKRATEKYLKASSITYTILAPNAFMEVWPGMVVGMPAMNGLPVTLVGEGKRKHSFISVVDVAAFGAAAAGNPEAYNKMLILGGPGALSFRDCAAVYEKALGRPVTINTVAPGEPVPGLDEGMAAMLAGFDMFDSPIEMAEACRVFGVALTPFEEVVRRQVGHALATGPA